MKKYIYLFLATSILNSYILLNFTCGFNFRFLIGEFLILLLIVSFSYLIKNKKLYFLIWSIILSVVCVINSIYFNEYNDFVSICLFKTFIQALVLPKEAITNVFEIKDFVFLYQILLFGIIYIFDKNKYNCDKKSFKNTILYSFITFVILILTLNINDIYYLTHEWNKVYKARNFGIYFYQLTDVFYNFKNIFKIDNDFKYIDEFYSSKTKENNEYTNIFKDKNIIFIHAESIQSMFINESINGSEITPNLNNLVSSGMYFSNFYSEESVGTSSDTEYVLSTSMLPIAVGTTFLDYDDNTLSTIQKSFKNNDYYVFSMHGNTCEFWNRNKVYDNIGYDHYYCYDYYNLDDKIGLGLSDKSFFNQSSETISNIDSKFAATLIMLTNHTPFYNEGKVDFDVSYMEGTTLGDYIKLVHYADEAIGEFITKLDTLGVLDNTVIVIYGDHDAKIKSSDYDRYFNYDAVSGKKKSKNDSDYIDIDFYKYEEISRVPLIIWTKDNSISGNISKVMGMIDVYPTLANMFGLDCKYCLGNDIFSIDENIVVFPNGNWVTDKVYYNTQYSEYKILNGEVNSNYINDKEMYARKIVQISNDTLKYNLVK